MIFFAISIDKFLSLVRSKFGNAIPIPGDNVNLNGSDLMSQGREDQEKLREELKKIFDELTYAKIAAGDAELSDAVNKVQERIPMRIFVG